LKSVCWIQESRPHSCITPSCWNITVTFFERCLFLKFSFLLSYVCTPTQEVKPPQARMPKVRQSTPDYLCILPLLWQMSSKVEVLASCSLIRRLKFHLCVVMLLDSRLSRNHSEISKNCSLEHSIYNFVQLFGAMPLTSSVHASVTNSVELENEDSNE